MTNPTYKYRAFISYSHQDASWGDWLHQGLEHYRVPKPLVNQTGRDGPIPSKLFPVFRDREELPSAVDLSEQIDAALIGSAYLIVICSPRSAASLWVNEEIKAFKRLGKCNRILAVIVEGEPNALDKPNFDDALECFPEALKYNLGDDGELSTTRTEPIAADARPESDGKDNALLKLVAGLLGVGFNDLKRREEVAARARLRLARTIAGSMALLAVAAVIAGIFAWQQRDLAVSERNRAWVGQSLYLADTSQQLQARGDSNTAMLVALEGLPSEREPDRPWVAESEQALAQAIHSNLDQWRWRSNNGNALGQAVISEDAASVFLVPSADTQIRTISSSDNRLLWSQQQAGQLILALSQDGQRLLSHSWHDVPAEGGEPTYGETTLHNATTGEVIQSWSSEYSVNPPPVQSLFSEDGRYLVQLQVDGVDLVDAITGAALGQFSSNQPINSVAFSADGKALIANGGNASWLLTVPGLSQLRKLSKPSFGESLWSIHFTADSSRLINVEQRGLLIINAIDGSVIKAEKLQGTPTHATLDPTGLQVAIGFTGPMNDWIGIHSAENAAGISQTGMEKGSVAVLTFSPDGKQLAVGGRNGSIRLIDSQSGQITMLHPGFGIVDDRHAIAMLEFVGNGDELIAVLPNGAVMLFDFVAQSANQLAQAGALSSPPQLSADKQSLLLHIENTRFMLINLPSRSVINQWQHSSAILNAQFVNQGNQVFTASLDDARLINTAENLAWRYQAAAPIEAMRFDSTSAELRVQTENEVIRIDSASGTRVEGSSEATSNQTEAAVASDKLPPQLADKLADKLDGNILDAQYGPNRKWLAVRSESQVGIFATDSWTLRAKIGHAGYAPQTMLFSDAGDAIFVGFDNGLIRGHHILPAGPAIIEDVHGRLTVGHTQLSDAEREAYHLLP